MTVQVHYFQSDPPNFGDELNTLVWRALIPEIEYTEREAVLVGIGTILDHNVPRHPEVFVMGAGAGLAPLPEGLRDGTITVVAVRGPLTAAMAGLSPELAVTDPALLLRALYPHLLKSRSASTSGKVIFVPHLTTAKDYGWRRACERAGVEFVDPTGDCQAILRKIASARLVIAEAMHGAIVADAFGVPWIPVASTSHFSTFKWVDWTLSMKVPFRLVQLPAASVRHWCQRAWLGAFAERFAEDVEINSGDAETGSSKEIERLLQRTAWRSEQPPGKMVTWFRLKAAAVHTRLLDPLVARLPRVFLRPVEDRMEARVARVFMHLATSKGYRSTDELRAERLQRLQERVDWLRIRLASGSRQRAAI